MVSLFGIMIFLYNGLFSLLIIPVNNKNRTCVGSIYSIGLVIVFTLLITVFVNVLGMDELIR